MAALDSSVSYSLSIRSDRPIENCELNPVIYLQQRGGSGNEGSNRSKFLDTNAYYYIFSWKRGPKRPACENPTCPRGSTFEPVQWCKFAIGGPELVCNVCTTAGFPSYEAAFCSKNCFTTAWKEHSKKHTTTLRKLSSLSEPSLPSSPTPLDDSPEESDETANFPTQSSPLPLLSPGESDWPSLSSEKTYLPKAGDVGRRLRLEVSAFSSLDHVLLAGPVVLYTEPVLSMPHKSPKRSLQTIPGSGQGIAGAVRFRVVSYNILAEIYATRQAYPYVDHWNLSWPYRKKILFEELDEMQGDVVCLQEVQADHFDADLLPYMQTLGYEGLFKAKSREYTGQYGKVDGCAVFFKTNKFSLSEHYAIEFNDLARQEASSRGLEDSDARYYLNRLNRDNIAQIVVLDNIGKSSGRTHRTSLCVVNTHLYSNTQRSDVKLWQTMNLVREIQQFVVSRDLGLILCGDFNSEPHSAVYDFITQGRLNTNSEYPELAAIDSKIQILPSLHNIDHGLDLSSAMQAALGTEPLFTNYTAKFKGTLDYIFYTPSRVRIMAITAIPDEGELRAQAGEGLPGVCYPSDHILLCCDVALMSGGNAVSDHVSNNMMQQSMVHSNNNAGSGKMKGRK